MNVNVAERIEIGRQSMEVIQGGAASAELESTLVKYDDLVGLLSENHQLVLAVLRTVETPTYIAHTPIRQEMLNRIVSKGPALLKSIDKDMLKIADAQGNFEDNAIYGSLSRLRESVTLTVKNYSRMSGAV